MHQERMKGSMHQKKGRKEGCIKESKNSRMHQGKNER